MLALPCKAKMRTARAHGTTACRLLEKWWKQKWTKETLIFEKLAGLSRVLFVFHFFSSSWINKKQVSSLQIVHDGTSHSETCWIQYIHIYILYTYYWTFQVSIPSWREVGLSVKNSRSSSPRQRAKDLFQKFYQYCCERYQRALADGKVGGCENMWKLYKIIRCPGGLQVKLKALQLLWYSIR